MSDSFTLIADSNITALDRYFNTQNLSVNIDVIGMSGRGITADIIKKYQPDALLIRSVTPINQSLLADNRSVKFVGSATIGTDHVDSDYLASRNIPFANAGGCSKHSVAQYVISALLQLHAFKHKLYRTLGIIGLGNIGSCLAKYAHDLGWQVLGYDPLIEKQNQPNYINMVSFEHLLTHADAISLHVPFTQKNQSNHPTYHLIDEQAFGLMKPDCLLINTSRGQVLKESALMQDLAKTARQVVLDVFEHEPIIHGDVLNQLSIATPHIAGYTLEGKLRGTQMIYHSFCECFQLPMTQTMNDLLPPNPFQWQDLLADLQANDLQKLTDFYPIMEDDRQLRACLKANKINGDDFDHLRKNYTLRREWLS